MFDARRFRYATNVAALYAAAGGGGGNEAETDTLIAAMSVAPDATREGHINTLIAALKSAGIWSKLDILYVLAAHDAQAARLNWKDPANYALTAVNSPTFTTDRGYNGDAATQYLNTGWDPATNGSQYTQNSASFFAWDRTNATPSASLGGKAGGSNETNIFPSFSGSAFTRVNDATGSGGFSNTGTNAFWHGDRQSSTARTGYKNGVSIGTYGSVASGALTSADFFICGANNGSGGLTNPSSHQIACAGWGASLNSEKTDLYNAFQTYMTAVGA